MHCAAVLDGDDPKMGIFLEYQQPGFELSPYFDKLGDQFMINLGPAGGLQLAIRDPAEVRCH